MDANQLADSLGVMPLYKQKESARWSSAVHLYQDMLSNANSEAASPEEPRTPEGTPEKKPPLSPLKANPSQRPIPIGNSQSLTNIGFILSPQNGSCPALGSRSGLAILGGLGSGQSSKGPGVNRRGSLGLISPPEAAGPNTLELEAVAAVHELSFAVEAIWVSDMLPRTPELIFVNVTTVEGHPFCLELTTKGWRVTSLRHDCMNGDINHLDLHIRYFDSIYPLMDRISHGYRNRFTETLAARLHQLEVSQHELATSKKASVRSISTDGLLSRVLLDEALKARECTDGFLEKKTETNLGEGKEQQNFEETTGNSSHLDEKAIREGPTGPLGCATGPLGFPRPMFEF